MTNSNSRKLDSRFLAITLVFVPAIMIASWASAAKADAGIVKGPELHIAARPGACKVTERLVTTPSGAQRIVRHFVCEKSAK